MSMIMEQTKAQINTKKSDPQLAQYMDQIVDTVHEWLDFAGYIDSGDEIDPDSEKELRRALGGVLSGILAQIMAKKTSGAPKEKKPRDPDAPKRTKSAYMYFCDEERAKVATEMTKANNGVEPKPTKVIQELGKRWKALQKSKAKKDTDRLERLKAESVTDKERYDSEKAAYEAPTTSQIVAKVTAAKVAKVEARKSARGQKDPNAPKKPATAYQLFCDAHRDIVRNEKGQDEKGRPIRTGLETNVILNEMWKDLKADKDNTELAKYTRKAAKAKTQYDAEMAAYTGSEAGSEEGSGTDNMDTA